MPLRTSLAIACLASVAAAQLSLPVLPGGNAYLWGQPTNCQVFFDMTVNTTVTFQGLTYSGYTPVGQSGSIDMWLTNTGTTTYVGNELNASVWSMAASGPSVYPAAPVTPSVCFTTGAVVQPGTYGVAIRYNGGIAPLFYLGNGTNQNFQNAELSVTAGATQFSAFTVAPFTPYVFSGTLFYGLGSVAHACAEKKSYGNGCYASTGSFWQKWITPGQTAAALNGRRLTLTYTGSGYILGQGTTASYIAPSASATPIAATSNGEAQVSLPSTILHPGGTASTLYVSSNGYVSDGPNQTPPGSLSNLPHSGGLLQAPATMWALAWHDFNPAETSSGVIKYEQVGNLFVITWDNVESWPNTVLNPSTLQIQFDLLTNDVHYVYQTITTTGGSPYWDATLVGYSPGGVSPELAPIDVTTLTSVLLTSPEALPVQLTAVQPPVLGTSVDLITSNEGSASVGINFLGVTPIAAPGLDLGFLGAPGCAALVDPTTAVGNVISNLGAPFPGMTLTLPIPLTPALAGAVVVSQSVWLDAAANPFGAKTSNGVSLTLGTFGL